MFKNQTCDGQATTNSSHIVYFGEETKNTYSTFLVYFFNEDTYFIQIVLRCCLTRQLITEKFIHGFISLILPKYLSS